MHRIGVRFFWLHLFFEFFVVAAHLAAWGRYARLDAPALVLVPSPGAHVG